MKSPICVFALVFGLATTSVQAQALASEFTTTDPKKVKILEDSALEKEPEIDHFQHLCPGLGGYEVFHEGGDLRSWINLRYKGKKTDLMNDTLTACPGQFPSKANDVVQWRGYRRDGKFVPYAIIYRMRSSEEETQKTMDTLIIIKLDGERSRVVGHVSGKEGNEKAEEVADRLCGGGETKPLKIELADTQRPWSPSSVPARARLLNFRLGKTQRPHGGAGPMGHAAFSPAGGSLRPRIARRSIPTQYLLRSLVVESPSGPMVGRERWACRVFSGG